MTPNEIPATAGPIWADEGKWPELVAALPDDRLTEGIKTLERMAVVRTYRDVAACFQIFDGLSDLDAGHRAMEYDDWFKGNSRELAKEYWPKLYNTLEEEVVKRAKIAQANVNPEVY